MNASSVAAPSLQSLETENGNAALVPAKDPAMAKIEEL